MTLSKDADKMICCIYKSYLQRRKDGTDKPKARYFEADYFKTDKILSSWLKDDIADTLLELGRSKLLSIYFGGNFEFTNDGIIYMENRFKDGLIEITDFISKFIP